MNRHVSLKGELEDNNKDNFVPPIPHLTEIHHDDKNNLGRAIPQPREIHDEERENVIH
jgi:hypothetical protein